MGWRITCIAPLLLLLAACSPDAPMQDLSARRASGTLHLPAMKHFAQTIVTPPSRPNSEIARDFLDLSFRMESGRPLAVMTRFEGPVTLRITGRIPPTLGPDLAHLLGRLHREAHIAIRRVSAGHDANITIEVVPRGQMQRLVPQAACFVVPRLTGWAQYRRLRRSSAIDWSTLTERKRLAIFIPDDVSPQEVRDCLHEELAQALGPLNDLYRLPDSVFNDDNFQTVLTGFDMLILRLYYAPELHNGMSRSAVAARLPALLRRLNPAGNRRATRPPPAPTTRHWIELIETALGPGTGHRARRQAARQAVAVARQQGWVDTRLAFSLFAYGRLSLGEAPDQALVAFLEARDIYRARPETRIHLAHVAMQLAAFSLTLGDPETVIELVNKNVKPVAQAQNAALLASLLMLKAEALDQTGRASEARAVRLDSLGWARYGFGAGRDVRVRMAEIAALAPGKPLQGGL